MDSITEERIKELLEHEQRYNELKAKRSEYNKKGYKQWRTSIDEAKYKEMRKISNAKYNEKRKLVKEL
jgi:hypothetical protein